MENRIKEQQLALFADRTSTATLRANQLRLYFSSIAYTLMLGYADWDWPAPRWLGAVPHDRLKPLKIGAHVHMTVRKV